MTYFCDETGTLNRTLYRIAASVLALAVAAFTVSRFYNLENVPRGFYVDEAAASLEAICIADEGRGAYNRDQYPVFFAPATNGSHSPTWVYTGALWSMLFGRSIASFRAISATATFITIIGVYLLGRALFGERAARLALLCASISPWAFQFSRIAWDSSLVPMFTVWGLIFFLRAREDRLVLAALSGLFFSLAAYSYGTARITSVPLLCATAAYLRAKGQGHRSVLTRALIVFAVSSLAILGGYANGILAKRVAQISIFPILSEQGVLAFLKTFAGNYFSHFSPTFLFISGDAINLRHTTHETGMLSWVDAMGWALLVVWLFAFRSRKDSNDYRGTLPAALLVIFAVLINFVPGSLTSDSLPHGLRSSGAWPFVALGAGWGLELLLRRSASMIYALTLLTVAFSTFYLHLFFTRYVENAVGFFDARVLTRARQAEQSGDWSDVRRMHESLSRYYLTAYGGRTCEESLNEFIQAQGKPSRPPRSRFGLPPLFVQLGLIAISMIFASRRSAKDENAERDREKAGERKISAT